MEYLHYLGFLQRGGTLDPGSPEAATARPDPVSTKLPEVQSVLIGPLPAQPRLTGRTTLRLTNHGAQRHGTLERRVIHGHGSTPCTQ